jgi:nucleotide-binding universal stress UspA family protein
MFPPRRILAAVDFSDPSRIALTMAARLAVQCQAELHVLYAEDPLLCAAARIDGVDLSREAREEFNTFLAASALPPGIVTHPHVIAGQASNVICDIGCREQADVIVIGARGMSGVERLVFGSTAEGVLRRTDIPVLLVPHTWSPPSISSTDLSGMGPVIAGVDFTAGSLQAMAAGFRLARTLHCSLELLHVVPVLPVIERWKPHAARMVAERVEDASTELKRLARGLMIGIAVDTHVDTGPVAECIANAARSEGARHPLLVLGRRRPAGYGDAPGAIAYRVVSLAQVPTLMFMECETPD